jgi:hypothetical protein
MGNKPTELHAKANKSHTYFYPDDDAMVIYPVETANTAVLAGQFTAQQLRDIADWISPTNN